MPKSYIGNGKEGRKNTELELHLTRRVGGFNEGRTFGYVLLAGLKVGRGGERSATSLRFLAPSLRSLSLHSPFKPNFPSESVASRRCTDTHGFKSIAHSICQFN